MWPGWAAVLLGVLVLAACGGDEDSGDGGGDPDRPGPGPAVACKPVEEVEVPEASDYHKDQAFKASDYSSNPPAGGPHSLDFLTNPGIHQPVEPGKAVHSLNHGAVILWAGDDLAPNDSKTLMKTYRKLAAKDPFKPGDRYSELAIVDKPDLDVPFAMSAWGRVQKCGSVDPKAIESFVEKYYGSGPEGQAVACGDAAGLGEKPRVPACTANPMKRGSERKRG